MMVSTNERSLSFRFPASVIQFAEPKENKKNSQTGCLHIIEVVFIFTLSTIHDGLASTLCLLSWRLLERLQAD